MNICIIGAGISGLAIGKLLKSDHKITIYEKESNIGGIARIKDVNNIAYHLVGGHCFNSKNKEVMDFVFNEVLPIENWHLVKREAKINIDNHLISYPIEYSIRQIAEFDKDLAFNMTKDFLSSSDINADNLEDWFKVKFGDTLANKYFIPYNKKIWQMDLSEMSPLWIDGKLPLPNKQEFFEALIGDKNDTMPHSTFYYPNDNNKNTFIEALAIGLNIVKDFKVESIEKIENKWVINNEFEYDLVINTMPLNLLPFVLKSVPSNVKEEANKLKYNKVTNMLWKTKNVDHTWTYYPSEDTIFHRHIHIGNFFNQKADYTITESMGEHSYEEMVNHGNAFEYLLEPIDYNVSDYAYVVYDQNYNIATKVIKDYMCSINLHTIGRFGEWEYYNMDVCIESAFKLAKKIK